MTKASEKLISLANAQRTIAPTKANLLATVEDTNNEIKMLGRLQWQYVARCREEGATWAEIGARLGTNAKAAQMRYRYHTSPKATS
jgi:hypothetical protein